MTRTRRWVLAVLLARQITILNGMRQAMRFLNAGVAAAPEGSDARFVVVLPVLRERGHLSELVAHMAALPATHPVRVVVVTTEREVAEGTPTSASTAAAAAQLAGQGRCEHVHYPCPDGLKADQVNHAAAALAAESDDTENTFVVCYDADSRPPPSTLKHFETAIAEYPNSNVFHQSSKFHLPTNRASVDRGWATGLGSAICDACALRANRFVLGFELPRLLARSSRNRWRRAAASHVYAHVTGHGLCLRLSVLLERPLPARSPMEDMHYSFLLGAANESLVPIRSLDSAEVPPNVTAQWRQAARWFAGPARASQYARQASGPRHRVVALTASALGSSAEWVGCAVVPMLTAAATAHRDRPTRLLATTVSAVFVMQLAVADAAFGGQDPLRLRARRLLLAPASFFVHGCAGAIGVGDIARGHARIDKTERR